MTIKYYSLPHTTDFVHHILMVLVICLTIFFTFLVMPIDKPDENVHFYKSYAVSQGRFVCELRNNQPYNPMPLDVINFVTRFRTGGELNSPMTVIDEHSLNEKTSCVLPFYYYLAPGLVIALLSQLGASLPIIFFAGRGINALLALALLYFSARKLPRNFQLISLYIYSLPMVAFQISSYSKDAYHLAFGIVLFNTTLHLIHQRKAAKKDLLLFVLSAIAFVLTRIQYVPFLSLFFVLPKSGRRIQHTLHRNIILAVITLLIASGVMFLAISNNIYLSAYNRNTQLAYHNLIDPQQQILFILQHPFSFFTTSVNTIFSYWSFYVKGVIGILGWLDKPLPDLVYMAYIILGIYVTGLIAISKEIEDVRQAMKFFIAVFIFTLLALFIAMYLYGSPVGHHLIYGLQGRYFIMLMPLFILITALALRNSIEFLYRAMHHMKDSHHKS